MGDGTLPVGWTEKTGRYGMFYARSDGREQYERPTCKNCPRAYCKATVWCRKEQSGKPARYIRSYQAGLRPSDLKLHDYDSQKPHWEITDNNGHTLAVYDALQEEGGSAVLPDTPWGANNQNNGIRYQVVKPRSGDEHDPKTYLNVFKKERVPRLAQAIEKLTDL